MDVAGAYKYADKTQKFSRLFNSLSKIINLRNFHSSPVRLQTLIQHFFSV